MKHQVFNQRHGLRWWGARILIAVLALMVIFGAVTWVAGESAKANLMKQYPAPGQLMNVGGFKMHIYCVGQGSLTIILESGLDDFSIFWSQVQPEVAKFTRVCAYDRAGLGWSEPSPNPRTSATMVKELRTLLVNTKIEPPFILVGHSFGGALAQAYAYSFPDQVMGMVLVDAAPTDLFNRIPMWHKLFEQKIGMLRTLAPLSSLGLLALTPEGGVPDRGLTNPALAQYRAIAVSTRHFETGVVENESFEKNLAEIRGAHITSFGKMPLVVLSRGYWDPLPGFSQTENQQAWQEWQKMQTELLALSNSQQIIAEKSEHSIQIQQPQLVIDAIRQVFANTSK